jgi:hypothetical protein
MRKGVELTLGMDIDRFEPGVLVVTPGIANARERSIINVAALFKRHFSGDYGDIEDDDKRANERIIKDGSRIVSGYDNNAGKVFIITDAESERTVLPDYVEGHRAFTTIMLSSEYELLKTVDDRARSLAQRREYNDRLS